MSERSAARSKRTGSSTARKAVPEVSLAEENARLKAELAQAQARIAELEQKHTEIVNRIDWVIDSLHNLHG